MGRPRSADSRRKAVLRHPRCEDDRQIAHVELRQRDPWGEHGHEVGEVQHGVGVLAHEDHVAVGRLGLEADDHRARGGDLHRSGRRERDGRRRRRRVHAAGEVQLGDLEHRQGVEDSELGQLDSDGDVGRLDAHRPRLEDDVDGLEDQGRGHCPHCLLQLGRQAAQRVGRPDERLQHAEAAGQADVLERHRHRERRRRRRQVDRHAAADPVAEVHRGLQFGGRDGDRRVSRRRCVAEGEDQRHGWRVRRRRGFRSPVWSGERPPAGRGRSRRRAVAAR